MQTNKENGEILKDKFRNIEALIKSIYPESIYADKSPARWLAEDTDLIDEDKKEVLNDCRKVRNLLSHTRDYNDQAAVTPSMGLIEALEDLYDFLNGGKLALDTGVRLEQIYSCELNDPIRPAITEMVEKNYTHVPILKDGVVKGVFSENTLLSYIHDNGSMAIDDASTFASLGDFLLPEKHYSESFRFIAEDVTVEDVADIISTAAESGDRVGIVFITRTGQPNDKLLGIITPWDIAGN